MPDNSIITGASNDLYKKNKRVIFEQECHMKDKL